MEALTKEMCEEIKEYINKNQDEVIDVVGKRVGHYINMAEYNEFCPDGFDVMSLVEDKDHLCRVYAKGSVHVGKLVNSEDGPWPDDHVEKTKFTFFVDKDQTGDYKFDYCRDENGEIDPSATLVDPDQFGNID